MLNFMLGVIERLPISQNNVRIGMVTFADKARSDVFLDTYNDRTSLINAVRNARLVNFHHFADIMNLHIWENHGRQH